MMLSGKQIEAIYDDCQRVYPKETVGVLIGPEGMSHQDRVVSCINYLDELHECDPTRYPCGAESGFAVNPDRLLLIDAELRAKGWRMKLIYHSHPDGDAQFSDADRRNGVAFDGSPLQPNVEYMVVAVENGKVVGHTFYRWDDAASGFVSV
jgi:proteasome lid subunit RPN8/RPN11